MSMATKGKHFPLEGTWSSKEILSPIQNDKIFQEIMSTLFSKTNQVHFNSLKRQRTWATLVLLLSQIYTHTGTCIHTQRQKTALPHKQHVLDG